jgi:hypothetical protein
MPEASPCQIEGEQIVYVGWSCRMGMHEDCKCMAQDGADPEDVGYPPYHDGCKCFVVTKVDQEIGRKGPCGCW